MLQYIFIKITKQCNQYILGVCLKNVMPDDFFHQLYKKKMYVQMKIYTFGILEKPMHASKNGQILFLLRLLH